MVYMKTLYGFIQTGHENLATKGRFSTKTGLFPLKFRGVNHLGISDKGVRFLIGILREVSYEWFTPREIWHGVSAVVGKMTKLSLGLVNALFWR